MKRLIKKNRRDIYNRDAAITYIDEQIFEGYTHSECINEYLNKYKNIGFEYDCGRPNLDHDEMSPNSKMTFDNVEKLGFAHKCDKDMSIYIEENSLFNVDINTVANKIKQKYPDYDMYTDEEDMKIARRGDIMKRLIKKAYHGESNRDYAFLFIDGKGYMESDHGICIEKYMEDNDIENTDETQAEIYDSKMVYGHVVGSEIYLMTSMIYNMSLEECVQSVKQAYSQYDIYDDDNVIYNDDDSISYPKLT